MKRLFFAFIFLATGAFADGPFIPGQVLTASQLNAALAQKADNTSAAITGGTINGTTIGGSVPRPGTFTTLNATTLNAANLTASGGSALIGYIQGGSGSVSRTVAARLADAVDAEDFGAIGNGAFDDTPAINAALTAGKKVRLACKNYKISTSISISASGQALIGGGWGCTTITAANTNLPAITIAAGISNFDLQGFTVTRTGTAVSGGDGVKVLGSIATSHIAGLRVANHYRGVVLDVTDYSLFERSIVEKNQSDGVLISNSIANGQLQWSMRDVLAQMNGGSGFAIVSTAGPSQVTLGTYSNLAAFGNSGHGLKAVGSAGVPVQGVRIDGGFFGQDGASEIYLDTYGSQHKIDAVFVELAGTSTTGPVLLTPATNVGSGVEITANNDYTQIVSVHSYANSFDGVATSGVETLIVGGRIQNNGQAASAGRRNGVNNPAGRLSVAGSLIGNTAGASQQYGVFAANGANVSVGTTDLTNNATACYSATSNQSETVMGLNTPSTCNVGHLSSPTFDSAGSANITFNTSSGTQLVVSNVASPANYLTLNGNTAGSPVQITAAGSDSNVGLSLITKGTSPIYMSTGGGIQAELINTPSATRFLTFTGSAAGNPTISTSAGGLTLTPDVTLGGKINKVTLTAPASGSTLTIADGKTLTASNTLTLTGTDASSVAFGTGGTVQYSGASATFTTLGVGVAPSAAIQSYIAGTFGSSATNYASGVGTTVGSAVTTEFDGYNTAIATQAASFTLANLSHFKAGQSTIGAGSSVTTQIGFSATNSLSGATNNYGFYGALAAASGKWNFFGAGTANNAFAGNTRFGATTAPVATVDVTGSIAHTQQEIDRSYTYNTPTTGQTVTIASGTQTAIINPAGTLATLTVTLPTCDAAYDGSLVRYSSEQVITALTVNATSGSVSGAPASLAIGAGNGYICRGTNTTWYRLY